jgi:hypothetical protein
MIRSMEAFTYAMALDLNMDYCHFKLDTDAQTLYMIIFPWRKKKYKNLPMNLKISPDVFQKCHVKTEPGF